MVNKTNVVNSNIKCIYYANMCVLFTNNFFLQKTISSVFVSCVKRSFMFYLCYLYLFTCTGVQHDVHVRSRVCCLIVTGRVSHVEQELLILLRAPAFTPVLSGVRIVRSLVFYIFCCRSMFVFFVIVLYVLLRFTASDYFSMG